MSKHNAHIYALVENTKRVLMSLVVNGDMPTTEYRHRLDMIRIRLGVEDSE